MMLWASPAGDKCSVRVSDGAFFFPFCVDGPVCSFPVYLSWWCLHIFHTVWDFRINFSPITYKKPASLMILLRNSVKNQDNDIMSCKKKKIQSFSTHLHANGKYRVHTSSYTTEDIGTCFKTLQLKDSNYILARSSRWLRNKSKAQAEEKGQEMTLEILICSHKNAILNFRVTSAPLWVDQQDKSVKG